MRTRWFYVRGVTPEPWTAPSVARAGRFNKVYKNAELVAYQNAVRESLVQHQYMASDVASRPSSMTHFWAPMAIEIRLDVWFWRKREQYTNDKGRLVTKHQADRSNMLKSLEDALEGPQRGKAPDVPNWVGLFANDRQIVAGETTIVAQSKDLDESLIVFAISPRGFHPHKTVADALTQMTQMNYTHDDSGHWDEQP